MITLTTASVVLLIIGFFAALRWSPPVVSCASALKKSLSVPPAALLTAQDYFMHGDYEYEQGDCEKAISDYSKALKLNPSFAEAYNNRAYVYMVKKDYASALSDLNDALKIRPDYVNALMNRGDIYNYYFAINYERAVADYDQVLRIDPKAAEHTSVCGHRLLALNHGWSPNVFETFLQKGSKAGCP
ncbi:MAG TPA: tetratricopeptide repeat protein [Anaerolineales bacterium]